MPRFNLTPQERRALGIALRLHTKNMSNEDALTAAALATADELKSVVAPVIATIKAEKESMLSSLSSGYAEEQINIQSEIDTLNTIGTKF